MNLRQKVTCGLSLAGIFFLILIYIVSKNVFLDGFGQIETEQNLRHVERFRQLLSDELENLTTTTVAWSSWDDSFEYIQKPNNDFIKKNYLIETIFDSKFSRVMYFTNDGEILFSLDYFSRSKKIAPTSSIVTNEIREKIFNKIISFEKRETVTGFFHSENRMDYFSFNPVYTNSGSGKSNGYVAFFRVIDQEALDKYKRIMKFDVTLNYSEKIFSKNLEFSSPTTGDRVSAKIRFDDFLKKGQLVFEMSLSRKIAIFGEETFQRYMIYLLIVTMFGCLTILWIFDKYVVLRVVNLNDDLKNISLDQSELLRVRIEGEDEIGMLSKNINSTLDALDQRQLIINRTSKLSALGEIAASIAHEINNPLTVISGFSASISRAIEQDRIEKKDIQSKLQKIKDNVLRIEKIIKSLRFISRDGDNDLLMEVKVGAILEDVESLCIETIKNKNISIDKANFDSELMIKCRPVQIAQVLVNLINNSIDAISEQDHPWIRITTEVKASEIVISIADSGELIPIEVADKMLNPFFTTKSYGHGTGLGLSISKKIMVSHGGDIMLIRTPNTEFKLVFPS